MSRALLEPTPKNIAQVKAFLFRKWEEREQESHQKEEKFRAEYRRRFGDDDDGRYAARPFKPPSDLSDACKFSALFVSTLFGGRMRGNYDHYYVQLPNKQILDVNADSKDVQNMIAAHKSGNGEDPYRHDPIFISKGLRPDKRDVSRRVVAWLNEFSQEIHLGVHFERTNSGTIEIS